MGAGGVTYLPPEVSEFVENNADIWICKNRIEELPVLHNVHLNWHTAHRAVSTLTPPL